MILIQVPRGVTPCQVEFPKDVKERSCKGSMHLKPGSTKLITSAELEYLKKHHPKLRLHVAAEDVKDRVAEAKAKDEAEAAKKAKAKSDAKAKEDAAEAAKKAKAKKAAADGPKGGGSAK